jgi:hypothetical protein
MTTIIGVIVWMLNLDDARTKRPVSLHSKLEIAGRISSYSLRAIQYDAVFA